MKLSPKDKVKIMDDYNVGLVTKITIDKKYGMTRQGIYKMLRLNGIDTSGSRLPVTCSACGVEILRHRCRIRRTVNLFCDDTCYFAYLKPGNGAGPYIQNRHDNRLGRIKLNQSV